MMFDKDLLLSVSKPGRYIGGEVNAVRKDHKAVDVRVCLCFPDIYEIGMSHLGLRILYDLINRRSDCLAERVFSPWVDMEEKMRQLDLTLFSLETRTPVKNFDILGFSLTYELSYTNVLNILSMSRIALKSRERGKDDPLVIAGGVCSLNPEPMWEFIDCFVIGEAEEAMMEILDAYKDYKAKPLSERLSLLKALARIDGIYVPSLYEVESSSYARRSLYPGLPKTIKKRFVRDLSKVADLETWIVPYIEIVHDRLGIEIMRGCPNACRFCQARSCFYPLRLLSQEKILAAARRLYKKTGYEEISLLSLSSSDHPELKKVVGLLLEDLQGRGVNVSLPSLRAKQEVAELSCMLSSGKKATLTFAPEAGSERLRRLLKKNLKIEELLEVAKAAYSSGYRLLKLYFMIGLPTETDRDLDEIVALAQQLSSMKKKVDGYAAQVNVSISNFVPKPHTPFQWVQMESQERLLQKRSYLKAGFAKGSKKVKLSFHDARMSVTEGVLSRGDRRLSASILKAFESGAKFDAWADMFNPGIWQKAFLDTGVDLSVFLNEKERQAPLCWDFIDVGISREALHREGALP